MYCLFYIKAKRFENISIYLVHYSHAFNRGTINRLFNSAAVGLSEMSRHDT